MPPLVVIEADPVIRLMSWALEEEGLDVITVEPQVAVEAVRRHEPDCIILNATTYAVEVLAEIRRVRPGVKIIALGTTEVPTLLDASVPVPTTITNVINTVVEICQK